MTPQIELHIDVIQNQNYEKFFTKMHDKVRLPVNLKKCWVRCKVEMLRQDQCKAVCLLGLKNW